MSECGYIYLRFDRRHLKFLSDIGVYYHWQRPPWVYSTKNLTYNVIYSAISRIYPGCLLRATILLILHEFYQSKLLIWRNAYAEVMKSILSFREFIFAQSHKNIMLYLLDKKVTQQRVLWGIFPPAFCNTRVKSLTNDNCNVVKSYCQRSINTCQCGFHGVTETGQQRAESKVLLANVLVFVHTYHSR